MLPVSKIPLSKFQVPGNPSGPDKRVKDEDGGIWADWYLHYASNAKEDCDKGVLDEEETDSNVGCLFHWVTSGLSLHSLTRHMARSGSPYQKHYLGLQVLFCFVFLNINFIFFKQCC